MPSATEILGAVITPAVLISAAGLLVLSTSNRISRVVDRIRFLVGQTEQLQRESGNDAEESSRKRRNITEQMETMSSRALLLRSALTAFYVAIGFFVGTSIAIGTVAVLEMTHSWIPIIPAFIGIFILLFGSIQLIREAHLAFGLLLREVQSMKKHPDKPQ